MNSNLELKQEVDQLVSEVRRTHRYSMSRIYDLYNRVFGTHEQSQSCASCLKRKVNQLEDWLQTTKKEEEVVAEVLKPKKKPGRKKRVSPKEDEEGK